MAADLILLHSPLVGPATWSRLAPVLRGMGYGVHVPNLAEALGGNPPYYERMVAAAAAKAAGNEHYVLVAHSGAGALVPAIVSALGAHVVGIVFVDATLPSPGRSWLETAPDTLKAHLRQCESGGRMPPWKDWWPEGAIQNLIGDRTIYVEFAADSRDVPTAFLEEPVPAIELPASFQAAYLQLTSSYEDEFMRARGFGWPVAQLPLHHLAMLTHPEVVAAKLEFLMPRIRSSEF